MAQCICGEYFGDQIGPLCKKCRYIPNKVNEDAVKLGKEIEKRWNAYKQEKGE